MANRNMKGFSNEGLKGFNRGTRAEGKTSMFTSEETHGDEPRCSSRRDAVESW